MYLKRRVNKMDIFKEKFSIDNYLHIPSIQYQKKIHEFISKTNKLPIDLFVICIEYGGKRIFLGNYPIEVIMPYSFPEVQGVDPAFVLAKSANIFNYQSITHKAEITSFLKSEFSINNYFSVTYPFNNVFITSIFSGFITRDSGQIDIIVRNEKKQIREFVYHFIINMKSIIFDMLPPLRFLDIFRDDEYLKKNIFGEIINNFENLTTKELELLFWYKTGRTEDEIAKIMHLKPSTVKTYLKLIRSKLGTSNTREAVYFAEKAGYMI